MEKWICKVCGYTHEGEEAPELCPQCGATKAQFYLKVEPSVNVFNIVLGILVLAALLALFFSCRSSATVDNSPVSSVDLKRYAGRWYELARFDHKFERDMQYCTAYYSLQSDGTILVTNQGKKNGAWKTSVGRAKVTDEPGVLRVSFFRPFYSDYRILMLAPDYTYALVGGSGDDYLWILSRTPQLHQDIRDQLVHEAMRRGYQTDRLLWLKQ